MEDQKNDMVWKYIRGILFFLGLPVLLFLLAGTFKWWQAWVYVGISYFASILSRALLTKKHPDLVKERAGYNEKEDTKPWDKVLMPLAALVMPALYFITGGLDKRFGWSGPMPVWLYWVALLVTLASYAFSTWAILENRFFSAVVRIQTDRGQTVVDTGPYRFVRHPGYASGILVALLFPILIGSWWAYVPVGIMSVLVVIRTALEDKTLIAELPGYAEFTKKTRYRLLPGVW